MHLYNSLDEAMLGIIDDFYNDDKRPFISYSRKMECREFLNYSFIITDPHKRLIFNPYRKHSIMFQIAEFIWYMEGRNDLESIEYYNPRMKSFSDDMKILNSAYGHRLLGYNKNIGYNQIENIISMFKKDLYTRQAILHINVAQDMNKNSKDYPCTIYLQFFIRKEKLYMLTYMRSNDFLWGFTGSDCFFFTMLQEYILCRIKEFNKNIILGPYIHNAGSLHIYTKTENIILQIKNNEKNYEILGMEDMPFENILYQINKMAYIESELRKNNYINTDKILEKMCNDFSINVYWQNFLYVLAACVIYTKYNKKQKYTFLPKIWQKQLQLFFNR